MTTVILTREGRCASARAIAAALKKAGRPASAIVAEPWRRLVFEKGYLAAARRLLAAHGWRYPARKALALWRSRGGEPLKDFCRAQGLAYHAVDHHNGPACAGLLRGLQADAIITANTRVLSPEILTIPRLGGLNLHKSLLPRYAGLDAIFWALYHGEREIGVTIHRLAIGVDTGRIMRQTTIPVAPDDDVDSLDAKADIAAGPIMAEALCDLERGVEGAAQDPNQRSYFRWPSPAHRRELARRLARRARPARVIVNADDFGLTEGVNRAAIACHRKGAVTSATLIANGPAFEHAAALARSHPELGVGLHFNLTLGRPLAPADEVKSLVDASGAFHPRAALERRTLAGLVRTADVARELAAQHARLASARVAITHLDGHQHAHVLPRIFPAVAAFCREKNLPLRRPAVARPVLPAAARPGRAFTARRARRALLRLLLGLEWRRHGRGLRSNDHFASIFDILPPPESPVPSDYEQMILSAPGGTLEIMVHPAEEDAELARYTRIAGVSPRERDALATADFPGLAKKLGFELIHYGRL